jgi:hypothetical protein
LIKKDLKTLWTELRKDIEMNSIIMTLRDDSQLDKDFINAFAEYVQIKLQNHIIVKLKVHESKKNPNNKRGEGVSIGRQNYRVLEGMRRLGEDTDLKTCSRDIQKDALYGEDQRRKVREFADKYMDWFNEEKLLHGRKFKENELTMKEISIRTITQI